MIIFSYLGADIPKYALLNAKHTKLRFPELNVGMIVSNKQNASILQELGLNAFVYETKQNDELFSEMQAKRIDFRNGFWRFTLERLLSLEACFQENIENVIHVESDVILLNGFDKHSSPKSKISWLAHKDEEDSAAILGIRNRTDFDKFKADLRENFRKNPTFSEMQLLRIMRRNSPEDYELMPSILSDGTISPKLNTSSEKFVFDPATLGMWIFGYDPKNHFGFTRRSLIHGKRDSEAFALKISDNLGKPELYVNNETLVLSMHVHTKAEHVFIDPDSQIKALLDNEMSKNDFNPKILMSVYQEYAARGRRLAFFLEALGLLKYLIKIKDKINDFFR